MPDFPYRPLSTIAREIRREWKNVYFGAEPYLKAMAELTDAESHFGADSGGDIVRYFLSNATSWRGEAARRIKKELKDMLERPRHVREAEQKMTQ